MGEQELHSDPRALCLTGRQTHVYLVVKYVCDRRRNATAVKDLAVDVDLRDGPIVSGKTPERRGRVAGAKMSLFNFTC